MVQRIVRRAAVAAVGLALAVGVLGVSPSAASAATITPPTATVAKTPALATAQSAHACADFGTHDQYGNHAVFCADIKDDGNGFFDVWAEGICENTSNGITTIVQCSDIAFDFSAWSSVTGNVERFVYNCGHSPYGPCVDGRTLTPRQTIPGFGVCGQLWTVVWGTSETQNFPGSTITLPKSRAVQKLGADVGSGHVNSCP